MGSLTAGQYDPYDSGRGQEIFTLDPSNPARRVGEPPPDPSPSIGLLGLLLGLGYLATRQSSTPNMPTAPAAPTVPAAKEDDSNFASQRRVSTQMDKINGGPGWPAQIGPAAFSRTAQLTGLPDGGSNLGQRTPFPLVSGTTDFSDLPAVLRGLNVGSSTDASWQPRANDRTVGW